MLWYHSIVFGTIAVFTLIELGLSADWRNIWSGVTGSYISRIDFIIFCSIWTLISLFVHWMMPFLIAGVWAILTCFFWLIAAALASSADCVTFDGGFSRLCFGDVGRWQAVQAFAWLLFFSFLALLVCFWWHVHRRSDAGWRDGIYGKSYLWQNSSSNSKGVGHAAAPAQPAMTQAA